MNTQNTPVHVRLWHRDFWLLSFANLLLAMSVYILIPTMPEWLMQAKGLGARGVGLAMGVFGLGLFVFGPFCSYLVQRYRRNRICILAVLGIIACLLSLYYVHGLQSYRVSEGFVLAQRCLLGAFYGLAMMVLGSTLIIDTCESFKRTEANFSSGWFARFAMSLGPMTSIILYNFLSFDAVVLAATACAAAAGVFILTVRFPFRTPSDDLRIVSLDRFLLPQGMPLFFSLLLISGAVGLLMSLGLSDRFYALMMVGFLLALLAQRFVFRDAELKSEVVSGLILLLAVELMVYTRPLPVVWYLSPLLLGLSVGIVGSRYLLFFVKLSHHCQRGTSQSTYMLAWELGVAIGVGAGYLFFFNDDHSLLIAAMVVTGLALLLYVHYTHDWFLKHKNR